MIFSIKTVKTIDLDRAIFASSEIHLTSAEDKLNDNIVVIRREVVSIMPIMPNSAIEKTDVYKGKRKRPTIFNKILPIL